MIIGTANFLDMAKGTVVMMLLFVSVVYEKAANPFELTAGQTGPASLLTLYFLLQR